jgi:uncharacterized protein
VSATPTSDRFSARLALWRAGHGLALAAGLALAQVLAVSPDAQAGDGDENEPSTGFLDYLPAAPDIKAPNLSDIIPFWTDDLKKGKNAYRDGDYERARKYFSRASEDGNLVADWYLGHMYRLGRGADRDHAMAFSYYGRVADQYDPDEDNKKRLKIMVDGLVRVADYYRLGSKTAGIPQDFDRAIRIYKTAATYGHPAAEYALGLMHLRGQGLRQKPDQGLKWLLKSARRRYAPAEAKLGDLYARGEYVGESRTLALKWYILAQATVRPEENPEIIDRFKALMAEASDEERLEAEAQATVWSDRFPVSKAAAPPTD